MISSAVHPMFVAFTSMVATFLVPFSLSAGGGGSSFIVTSVFSCFVVCLHACFSG